MESYCNNKRMEVLIRCFSNGVQQGSDYTSSANIVSTEGYCRVGGGYNRTSLLVDGYIQDVRVYKGVAKYTSDFVVPSISPRYSPRHSIRCEW